MPKRLIFQIGFFLLQNPFLKNIADGKIYQGGLKAFCTPGLNCYSCPAAAAACPIGAMQAFLAGTRHSLSLFVTGFLLAAGLVLGRFVCGYICPMGLIQDAVYRFKTPKKLVRLRFARYLKYAVLAVFVFILPFFALNGLSGLGAPWFCAYLCPSGTIFAAIPILSANESLFGLAGAQLVLKIAVAAALLAASLTVYRFFCRTLCPLGAIYSMFNKVALLRMRCDAEKCVSCGACAGACAIGLDPAAEPNSPECVRCGKCVGVCENGALKAGFFGVAGSYSPEIDS